MHLHVITTGGTIDKVYFDAKSTFQVGEPQVAELFREAGVAFSYSVEVLFRKDSIDLTDADRQRVADRVRASEHDRVLVTHGTDTMAETARAVADALDTTGDDAKVVVFVGSLAPARFKTSDAEFNVGFAAAAVQALGPGVYLAMNGRVFDPYHVRKDREQNRFVAVTAGVPSP
jgi:L-asparaginase